MRNEFTAIFEMDDDRVEPRYVAYCAEIPGVNAEGNTMDEARANLTEAVSRALEERRAKTMREVLYDISPNATRETVVVQSLRNEFTAIIEWGEDWYVAFCPEMPAASGQGITREEARDNLAEAILLVLEDSRDDGLRGVPNEAIREVIVVQ